LDYFISQFPDETEKIQSVFSGNYLTLVGIIASRLNIRFAEGD